MQLNRENYESYFLDYLEGNLDENRVDDFIEFINAHPDLKEELTLFETLPLKPEDYSYPGKNALRKQKYDDPEVFNHTAVAYLEGDLNQAEIIEFEQYLVQQPAQKKELENFRLTFLSANKHLSFPHKGRIKRRSPSKLLIRWTSGIAATLLVAVISFSLWNRTDKPIDTNQVARIETPETIKPHVAPSDNALPRQDVETVQEIAPVTASVKSGTSIKKINRTKASPQPATDEKVMARTDALSVPAKMVAMHAGLPVKIHVADLAVMHLELPPSTGNEEEIWLADRLIEKTGIDKFPLSKIKKVGLKLVSGITGDKFRYETDDGGKITGYKYDSRLMAFSIPSKSLRTE